MIMKRYIYIHICVPNCVNINATVLSQYIHDLTPGSDIVAANAITLKGVIILLRTKGRIKIMWACHLSGTSQHAGVFVVQNQAPI